MSFLLCLYLEHYPLSKSTCLNSIKSSPKDLTLYSKLAGLLTDDETVQLPNKQKVTKNELLLLSGELNSGIFLKEMTSLFES
jgi:hypothetical protein